MQANPYLCNIEKTNKMKCKYGSWLLALLCVSCCVLQSCDDDDTYADKKKRERSQISSFIRNGVCVVDSVGDTILHVPPINPITERQFIEQDSMTDVSKNEYVLFPGTGIYMQIVRKGPGEKLKEGDNATIINRYIEFNIMGDSIQSRNNSAYYIATPDVMTCENNYGNYTASFVSGVMKTYYSAAVPSGWLYPLAYINIGRQVSEDEEIAMIRLIVPHSEGQKDASRSVYPCFYEITYARGRS